MGEQGRRIEGCSRGLLNAGSLFWFATVMLGTGAVVDAVAGEVVTQEMAGWLALGFRTGVTLIPFAVLAVAAGRRRPDGSVAALSASLAVISGYAVLNGFVNLVVPQREVLDGLRVRYVLAGLRLSVLVPYALLTAWVVSRGGGATRRPLRSLLGLGGGPPRVGFLSLALAAGLTLPWPLTGALGDSLSTLAISAQVLAETVTELIIFWGIVFVALTSSQIRTEGAALLTIVLFGLGRTGAALAGGERGAVAGAIFLLPLAFLLTELRARRGRLVALLPLALSYRLIPRLFVDSRDALASGIPELQHIFSYVGVVLGTVVLGLVLWLARRSSNRREGEGDWGGGGKGTWYGAAFLALGLWLTWSGLYVTLGEPGFFNDGFLIILEEQADLSQARATSGRRARLEAVYRALVETADRTQAPIRSELAELGVPYRSYYIINMIRVDGHRRLMGRFDGRAGVDRVILNPNVRKYPRRIPMPYGGGGEEEGLQGNLTAVHADRAWEMGATGEGVVVGGQDTGYAWDHPALKPQYRGWDGETADHAYNWHDAWDVTREPFDDGSHGTHTMGTVLGDDGGENRIGVAPDATWFGCRNMRRGFGNPGSYAECMEFLFAPYPFGGDPFLDGDVSLGAPVVNNSWGCPRMEGCYPDSLRPAVEALRAAGVMMVVSAGNDGPACRTAGTPPANYDAVFTVGATTDGGSVVGFSSRGPADGLLKPDISAPGEQVRSSVPGGGYGTAGGTSMAAPHIAGTVALVWSADPSLIGQVGLTEDLLCRAAAPKPVTASCDVISVPEGPLASAGTPQACACGGITGAPNNVYGCGLVDAGAAVEAALGE